MTLVLALTTLGCGFAIAMALFRARGRDEAADYLRFLAALTTMIALCLWLGKS